MKRRLTFLALVLALLASGLAALRHGQAVVANERDNRVIRALAAGHQAEPREGADPRALHARVLFLAWRGRLPEALELAAFMRDARPDLLAEAQIAIGNARMRAGFAQIDVNRIDDAIPEIELAKAAYREALRAVPGHPDARVNLDLAMRLVRDLPRPLAEGDDDPENQPRQLWTDLPGLPRGAP